ncbi:lysozyme inhibitor LprI family protein [Asticcacaulis sp.]|uniref:lysozyme inhibitor LprI family protein n=1 Tax=Asticcacaulis sp. TaxID=1872648 RepID=UPI0031E3C4C4
MTETGTYSVRVYLMRNDARRGKRADFKLNIKLESVSGPGAPSPRPPHGYGPSFDCRKASGVIETTICRSSHLSELDARLAFVYKDALAGASASRRVFIQRDQKTWLNGRSDCARRANVTTCLEKAYLARISVLEPK